MRTLEARRLFVKPVPGWHAKGGYTGQGRLIVANNGELRTADLDKLQWELPESTWSKGPEDAGSLAEFDGEAWTIVARRPHTEVTGPGGLEGESTPGAPVWSVGWDKRSLLLQVRSDGAWHTYRLPKGSYTYDPTHGWFTEWPRIESIGDGPLLLNMHGTFFDFPAAFDTKAARGIRPLSTHLHYTTDFTGWNGRVVLAGDDTSILQNQLASKPQSNLRFVARPDLATEFGPVFGWGGVWVDDMVTAGQPSDPVLVAGYAQGCLHLTHRSPSDVTFSIELDRSGNGSWQRWRTVAVPANGYVPLLFDAATPAEWLRVKVDRNCSATAFLHLSSPRTPTPSRREFLPVWRRGKPARHGLVDFCVRPASRVRCSSWRGGSMTPDGQSTRSTTRSTSTSSSGAFMRQPRSPISSRLPNRRLTTKSTPHRCS